MEVYSSRFQRKFPVLAAIVIGRNVANVPEIEEFLKGFSTDNQEVRKWLDTAMRKYLIRDYDKERPYKAKESDPAWMQGKEDLVQVVLDDKLHGELEHVIDFLSQNPDMKLNNFQAGEAFKQANDWLKSLLKKKTEEEA